MSVAEIVAQPEPNGGRQLPKEAFREGFVHALNAMRDLQAKGFTRLDEVAAICSAAAAGDLKRWAMERGAAYNSRAPKVWSGSTWWEIREKVLERDGRRCARCGSTKRLHIDHIQPVAKGGGPWLENLQVLCRTCNLQKGAD